MGNHKSTAVESDKKNKSGLIIKTCTWSKDSHSLYDYESQKQIKKDVISVSGTCNIVRVADEVKQDSQSENESQKDNLFQIKQNRSGYYFSQECMQQQNYDGLNKNSAWIVVRSLQNLSKNKTQGFQLTANDFLKLGRVRFRVKELSIKNQNNTDKSSANVINNYIYLAFYQYYFLNQLSKKKIFICFLQLYLFAYQIKCFQMLEQINLKSLSQSYIHSLINQRLLSQKFIIIFHLFAIQHSFKRLTQLFSHQEAEFLIVDIKKCKKKYFKKKNYPIRSENCNFSE